MKEAIKVQVTDVRVTLGIQLQVSNNKRLQLDTCNWTPKWLHIDYVTNKRMGIQSRSRILLQMWLSVL